MNGSGKDPEPVSEQQSWIAWMVIDLNALASITDHRAPVFEDYEALTALAAEMWGEERGEERRKARRRRWIAIGGCALATVVVTIVLRRMTASERWDLR